MTEDDVKRAVNIATRNAIQFREHTQCELDELIDELISTNSTIRGLCEKLGLPG